MLFQKKSNSRKYIEKIIRNRYGYPSQIIPINNDLGVLVGTFVKNRDSASAQYGLWLISLDFEYNSEGLAGFDVVTHKEDAPREHQRICYGVTQALTVLNTGIEENIERNYIARFIKKELAIYSRG